LSFLDKFVEQIQNNLMICIVYNIKNTRKDKGTVMNIIDNMLIKQKFQTFFEQNLATK
jgi:hypothetical protein